LCLQPTGNCVYILCHVCSSLVIHNRIVGILYFAIPCVSLALYVPCEWWQSIVKSRECKLYGYLCCVTRQCVCFTFKRGCQISSDFPGITLHFVNRNLCVCQFPLAVQCKLFQRTFINLSNCLFNRYANNINRVYDVLLNSRKFCSYFRHSECVN